MKNKKILVLNSGSSSIKVKIFNQDFSLNLEALLEKIGIDGQMTIKWNNQEIINDYNFPNHQLALKEFFNFLISHKIIVDFQEEIAVIGHRVVMGADLYIDPTLVNETVIQEIEKLNYLAPLHNPANILGVKQINSFVNNQNVMVFDTAFHQTIKKQNYLYPINNELYENNKIRKYGFHGISYQYTVNKFVEETNIKNPNLIVFHLGNGSSVCAIKNGVSFNTSMGFTPLAGLIMGTRSGDIDSSIVTFLQKTLNYSISEVDQLLNKKSGLFGLCGDSDMRDIQTQMETGSLKHKLAFDMFINKLVDYYSMYLNSLNNKIDGIIFTGGIGYNSQKVVLEFCSRIKISNLDLEYTKNNRIGWQKISSSKSQFPIYISETNEELEIAKQSLDLITKGN